MTVTAVWSSNDTGAGSGTGSGSGSGSDSQAGSEPGSNTGTTEAPVYQADGSDGTWSTIGRELEGSSASVVTIELGGTTVVPASMLEAIAGKDITVTFDLGGGIAWRIQGSDLKALQSRGQSWGGF